MRLTIKDPAVINHSFPPGKWTDGWRRSFIVNSQAQVLQDLHRCGNLHEKEKPTLAPRPRRIKVAKIGHLILWVFLSHPALGWGKFPTSIMDLVLL